MVLGISPDGVDSHRKFRAKFQLPYRLLADTTHAVCEQYGVWRLKSFLGKSYMGVQRTTYVIDADGCIAHVFTDVQPENHAAEVIAVLDHLSGGNAK